MVIIIPFWKKPRELYLSQFDMIVAIRRTWRMHFSNHHPFLEIHDFSTTEPKTSLQTRVCLFWSSRKKTEGSICLSLIVAVRQSSRTHLKARGLIFWILAIYMHISLPL